MSKKQPAAPAGIDDAKTYKVSVTEKVDLGNGAWLLPGRPARVSGRKLREFISKVSGEPIVVER